MIADNELAEFKSTLDKAKTIYVVMGSNPTTDVVAASLAWYLVLTEAGKSVYVVCESEMRVEWSHLVGLDKVGQKLGNKNLVVSFDYSEDKVDKVSFDGAQSRFNLVVLPKAGNPPPDPSTVTFSYSGAEADVVILPGLSSFASLGLIYSAEKKLFTESETVRLDNREVMPFAKKNLVDQNASGVSEVSFSVLEAIGFSVKGDTASNLMAGLDAATNRFSKGQISASTFMVASKLVENGARRLPDGTIHRQKPPALQPMSRMMSAHTPPGEEQIPMPSDDEQPPEANQRPPDEWLQPKIYSGATKI